jgi:hypothetical protein
MLKTVEKKSKNSQKTRNEYYCCDCDYYTSRKNDYEKHILTKKHIKKTLKTVEKSLKKSVKSRKIYICELCDSKYKDRSGLWRHKKICMVDSECESESESEEEEKKPSNNDKVLVDKELLMGMVELLKNGTNNTTNNTNTNCNNTYNNNITVQVYLDDYCKDAKSIESIKNQILKEVSQGLKLKDIVYPTNSQLIKDAPSNLFIKEIKKMPAEERPVHCADGKRGKFWVKKEEDGWVQEDVNYGGELKETISLFKGKLLATGRGEILDKGYERPNGWTQQELALSEKLGEKYDYKNKAIDNAIIAKLATECNIKDAIKDIEDKE